ncbi:MAG: hypothetical protein KBT87_05945 [Gammaproteobacteria bacterium]|jgi:hypothetical protein|nr:hypothetical protein [Gammaproteobacteria bacterium]MBQ0774196.1 hypothetical protein [Gammaproteobacteria bacterium]
MEGEALQLSRVIDVVKPILKPQSWANEEVLFAQMGGAETDHAPVVGFAIDQGSTIRFISKREADSDYADEDIMARAIGNLESTLSGSEWKILDMEGVPLALLSGDFYCAEAMLSTSMMKKAHDLLVSDTILAACPERGTLMAIALKVENPSAEEGRYVDAFASMVAERYFGTAQAAISPCVWAFKQGDLLGVKSLDETSLNKLKAEAEESVDSEVDALNIRAGWTSVDVMNGEAQRFHVFVDFTEQSKDSVVHFQHILKDLLHEHWASTERVNVDNNVAVVVSVSRELREQAEDEIGSMLTFINEQLKEITSWAMPRDLQFLLELKLDDGDGVCVNESDGIIAQAPFVIFYLVSAADGNVDKKEIEAFQGQCLALALGLKRLVGEGVQGIFVQHLGDMQAVMGRVVAELGSAEGAVESLTRIRGAVDDSYPEGEALAIKQFLFQIGHQIASASGGFLGFGSRVSKEEKAVLAAIAQVFNIVPDNS